MNATKKTYQIDREKKYCRFCDKERNVSTDFYKYRRKNSDRMEIMNKCKECHKAFRKKYAKRTNYKRKDNAQRCREYRLNHPERYREQKRRYIARKRATDKNFLVQDRISCQVYQFLKRKNLHKTNSFWKSVNYTPENLRESLESQFWYGMDWDNYGDWHIDHIKPKSKFKIEEYGDEQFHECWGLANMQPLWEEDNLIKGDYFEE
tara:strand:- start:9704 stop:10321 length:618 start_codon:yes stop_codon:yes gene_type:complete